MSLAFPAPARALRCAPDAPASDERRTDPDEVIPAASRPCLDARSKRVGLLLLGVDVMRWALNQHAPAFPRLEIELGNLEGDAVLGVGDASPEVFVDGAVVNRPEQDLAIVDLVVDGQHGQ